jgi:hypothetical protein
MFKPGDVVRFYNVSAQKKKFHLCLSLRGKFLYINSPKSRSFRGDFIVSCDEFPFLTPTESGMSVISCSMILTMSDQELQHLDATKLGSVKQALLEKLIRFVEASPVLSPDDKDAILDELGASI